jgi:hypothetical protein
VNFVDHPTRQEGRLLAALRAATSPEARALLHRVEASLATHPGLPDEHEAYGTEEHFEVFRSLAADFAAEGKINDLTKLLGGIEAEARDLQQKTTGSGQ